MSRRTGSPGSRTPRRPERSGRPAARAHPWTLHAPAEIGAEEARRLTRIAWGVAGVLGLGLLFMVLGPHRIGDYFTETDFYGAYAEGARLVQHGHLIPSRYGVVGPGYEVVLALLGLMVRNLFVAAELLSIAAVIATLLLWLDLIRRRLDARVALVAALFMATNAYFFRYGYTASTDALAMALQAGALWMLLARSGARAAVLAGQIAALAFLTRYNAVYLLPAGLIAVLAGGTGHPRRGRAALLFAAGFLVPVAAWVLYCLTHGSGFSFQLHHNIAYEVYARSKGIVWDEYQKTLQPQFHSLWDVIRRDPPLVATTMVRNLGDHLVKDAGRLLGWPVAIGSALGIVLLLRRGGLARIWPLALAGALVFLSLVPVFYSERYALPLVPLYATLAGAAFGLPRFAFAVGAGRRLWLKSVVAAVPLLLALAASVWFQVRAMDQLPVEVLESAATLRQLKRPGDRVIARKPHLAFHAGVASVPFPFADSLPQLAAYARGNHARWLFISWPEVETRPRFWHLLDTTGVVPGLTVRKTTAPHPSVLYEIGVDFGKRPAWYANDTLLAWHYARGHLMVIPNDPRALFTLAVVEKSRGDFESARRHLERAAHEKPNDYRTQLILGEIGLIQNDPGAATAGYQRALALNPQSVDAEIGLGWASLIAGREREAASLWRPVVDATRDPETLQRMVMVFRSIGDAESAARALDRLRELRRGG